MTTASLTENLITRTAAAVQPRLDALADDAREEFERGMDVTTAELCHWQERKSLAMMEGKLTQAEAQAIYAALGHGGPNGGWPTGTDLATKVAVTLVMGKVLGA